MIEPLEKEYEYYEENVSEWVRENRFKYVLIKDNTLVGFYKNAQEAFNDGLAKFGLDNFFIKQILPKNTTNITFLGHVLE